MSWTTMRSRRPSHPSLRNLIRKREGEFGRVDLANRREAKVGEQAAEVAPGAAAAKSLPQSNVARRAGQRAGYRVELPRMHVHDRRANRGLVRPHEPLQHSVGQESQRGTAARVGEVPASKGLGERKRKLPDTARVTVRYARNAPTEIRHPTNRSVTGCVTHPEL